MINQTLSYYNILEKLGAGGMGEVYRAEDTKLDRQVAIKVLPDIFAADPERLARFEREAKLLASLNHPNIASIYNLEEADGKRFLVLELVEGETLAERIRKGPLPVEEALEVCGQIAEGLESAHEKGIIHRDLKPANVKITPEGKVKILDFGLAKAFQEQPAPADISHSPTITQGMTAEGVILGTAAYMSPEQAKGKKVDARSDIFSLGSVLYEMLTGRRAFSGDSLASLMAAIIRDEPQPVSALVPSFSPDLENVICRAIRKESEQRYQSMTDLRMAIEGIKEELHSRSLKSVPSRAGGKAWKMAAALGSILLGCVALWWAGIGRISTEIEQIPAEAGPASIAVLPFDDLSSDRENEYFGDGMAEELINALAKIPGLRVVARTSAFSFKGKNVDVRIIGEQLGVASVLTGSVRRVGDRLRITTQLSSAEDGFNLWSEQYNRELVDIFAVQEEIARSIAEQLKVTLVGESEEAVVLAPTNSLEAYDLYLKGRFFWEQRGEGLKRGLEFFERAIELDPDFALAHAGVADACGLLSYYCKLLPVEAMPKARSSAEKALALAPQRGETHSAVAFVSWLDRDWGRAEQEFRLATEINPSYAPAHNFYGQFLLHVEGRIEEALHELERTVELDPLNAHALALLGINLICANRLTDAFSAINRAKVLNPALFHARSALVDLYVRQSRGAAAVAEAEAALEIIGEDPFTLSIQATALAGDGRVAEAEEVLNKLVTLSAKQYVSPTLLALTSEEVGKVDDAFQWLDRAYRERDINLATCLSNFWWNRDFVKDPRFRELRKRVGLEELGVKK